MNRPYAFCHMMTSLDGKITGPYMDTKQADESGDEFYEIAFGKDPYYKHQRWISGRITTYKNLHFMQNLKLKLEAQLYQKGIM